MTGARPSTTGAAASAAAVSDFGWAGVHPDSASAAINAHPAYEDFPDRLAAIQGHLPTTLLHHNKSIVRAAAGPEIVFYDGRITVGPHTANF